MNPKESPATSRKKEIAVWASISRLSVRLIICGGFFILVFLIGVIWDIIEAKAREPMELGTIKYNTSAWTSIGGIGLFLALLGTAFYLLAKQEHTKVSRKPPPLRTDHSK